jgi:hypothetical protein
MQYGQTYRNWCDLASVQMRICLEEMMKTPSSSNHLHRNVISVHGIISKVIQENQKWNLLQSRQSLSRFSEDEIEFVLFVFWWMFFFSISTLS